MQLEFETVFEKIDSDNYRLKMDLEINTIKYSEGTIVNRNKSIGGVFIRDILGADLILEPASYHLAGFTFQEKI